MRYLFQTLFISLFPKTASGWVSEWTMGPPCDDHQIGGYWGQRCDGFKLEDDRDDPEVLFGAWITCFLILSLLLIILVKNAYAISQSVTSALSTQPSGVWTRTTQSNRLQRI
ncbi:uncharacterized protein [Antedon mediterranea]|uniref:uncharacterized protein n=1 Tax=Antedon mediterranea TaxID=105859 RepID=UPI003AF73F21